MGRVLRESLNKAKMLLLERGRGVEIKFKFQFVINTYFKLSPWRLREVFGFAKFANHIQEMN